LEDDRKPYQNDIDNLEKEKQTLMK